MFLDNSVAAHGIAGERGLVLGGGIPSLTRSASEGEPGEIILIR